MIYAVTFCTLGEEFAGNIFHHSCLLLSRGAAGGKMEVVDNWGFYGLPTTTPDSVFGKLKVKIGLDVDFNGNHGMLRHEDTRYLEMGLGLHGVTFELTKEQFDELQARCWRLVQDQHDAIDEVVAALGIIGKDDKSTRIYSYEAYSQQIYTYERVKANADDRESRLRPFEINVSFGMWGPALSRSKTCKSQSVTILQGILTPEQIARITENGVHPTIPRYSGRLENIYLHSEGPLRAHKKRSGKVVYYRDAKKDSVRLYWTLPPQDIDVLSEDNRKLLTVSKRDLDSIKLVIGKLQQLEWLLINAVLPAENESYRNRLIEKIRRCYNQFSTIRENVSRPALYHLSDNDHTRLLAASQFIDNLYAGIIDNSRMYRDTEESDNRAIAVIIANMASEDRMALCRIIENPGSTKSSLLSRC